MNGSRVARSRHKALRVQADVPHTFGTLLIPLALFLVACGVFLVERPIADPLGAGIESVLLGSVVLACGLLLVAYLLRSVRIAALSKSLDERPAVSLPKPHPIVRRAQSANTGPAPSRSFHRVYVDDTRISL